MTPAHRTSPPGIPDGQALAGRFVFAPRLAETEEGHRLLAQQSAAFDFIVASPDTFVITDRDRSVISDGSMTWFTVGDEAVFVGPGRCRIPSKLREMLLPSGDLWSAVVHAESVGTAGVRTDRDLPVVLELHRAGGVSTVSTLRLINADPMMFQWEGPIGGLPFVNTRAFVLVDAAVGAPSPTSRARVHLEADHAGLAGYSEHGPHASLDEVVAWGRDRSDRVSVAVDQADGTRTFYSAGTTPIGSMPPWPPTA